MNSQSALVTVAMLSTLLNERRTDYLDLISPFALSLLPAEKGAIVDKQLVLDGLREQYGFEDFPVHVLTKILERASKLKNGYTSKRNNNYYVEKPYDRSSFVENQTKIKLAQDEVLIALQKYLQDNTRYRNASIDKAQELLIAFLEKKGLSIIGDTTDLKLVSPTEYDFYHVARFVLTTHKENSRVFSLLEEVVKGFFVYKAIYYFSAGQKSTIESRLKGTTVYFDTRLLIESLGYNTVEGKKAANELIRLIHSSGGQVKTFSYLKDEVAGILTKYARDAYSRYSMKLEFLDINGYCMADVMRLRDKLEISLNALGIEIEDQPSALSPQKQEEYNISALTTALQGNLGGESRPGRTDNDVSSISAILSARNGHHCYKIEACKAILATTNPAFTSTVDALYRSKLAGEIRLVIDDIDLTALLWLRSWDAKSTLPTDILLDNAYAACMPSTSLMDEFTRTVARLQKEDKITEEEALLLRTQAAPREDLLSETENDTASVTDNLVIKIRDKYAMSLTERKDTEIGSLTTELDRERKKKFAAIAKAEELAVQKKEKTVLALRIISIVVFVSLLATAAIALIISNVALDASTFLKIVLVFIGILGFVDSLKSRSGWVSKLISRAGNKRFDTVYGSELKRIEQYFE